ncbi:DUF2971 domain-containing protein [Actinoplanes auranticolor]|uniref:DUF2971 domain-containing protein n=1 Tax=Actinoplanes auranticolor TaxID=47988 RepID=UPI001BB2FFD3|nr:DUF2971 domain-containing protein [Actinoplanes auranticolor]
MIDLEAAFEAALNRAERTLTGDVFHYTGAEPAISGILRSGTLRLSPFESTNDLWESWPLRPGISSSADAPDRGPERGHWDDIDRIIRLHAKVACLTQDYEIADAFGRDALRGWNRLATWNHYGAGHSGICLRFDRQALISSFTVAPVPGALLRFHGPVEYRGISPGVGPSLVDLDQIEEFGLDAVATAYARDNHQQLFFRKHRDWGNELEYRLVLIDRSTLPAEIPIRDALTGVYLGVNFPERRRPAVLAALESYPDVEIFDVVHHGRNTFAHPVDRSSLAEKTLVVTSRRSGSLEERLAQLDAENQREKHRHDRAAEIHDKPNKAITVALKEIATTTRAWPRTEVGLTGRVDAIPPSQRVRRPNVPGKQVLLQTGVTCVVENLPRQSHTLVAGLALQTLEDDRVRVHAVITMEHWRPDTHERVECWQASEEVPPDDASATVEHLAERLMTALADTRADFDRARGG